MKRKQMVVLIWAFALTGCNPFSIIDKPSGDEQILSKARACFDERDYRCASEYYNKLSDSASDQKNSDLAFLALDQAGITISSLITGITDGGSSGGKLITHLAEVMSLQNPAPGKEMRLSIFHAYQTTAVIQDRRVRGLIRFITSLALMSEIIAENSTTPGKVLKSDLVLDPTACLDAGAPYSSSACNLPTGKTLVTGTLIASLDTATDDQISNTPSFAPTLSIFQAALTQSEVGMNEMSSQGSLNNSVANLTKDITTDDLAGQSSPIYRALMIKNDIGNNK